MIEWAKLLLPPFAIVVAATLALWLVWLCRVSLRVLLWELGIRNIKVFGVEVSIAAREVINAQENAVKKNRIKPEDKEEEGQITRIAEIAAPHVVGRRVLWVDDHPHYNTRERRALRAMRIEVHNGLNTDEAVEALRRDDYDLVISDITRGATSLREEGWETCAKIRSLRPSVPVIFYHNDRGKGEERDIRAKREGAVGATTSPGKLFRWSLFALLRASVLEDEETRYLLSLLPEDAQPPRPSR